MESFVPDKMPCRRKEKEKIRRFVRQGFSHKGNTNSLYISGMPGLGKTACVYEVVKNFSKAMPADFKFIQLNCLKLKTPNDFYSFLLKLMYNNLEKKSEEAKKILHTFFTLGEWVNLPKPKKNNASYVKPSDIVLLLVDEIDYLITRDQEILYNIFNWTHEESARIMIICIANTLDFSEKLITKIGSRMGHERLIFQPYSSDNLQEIISDRLKDTKVFSSDAIRFVGKKIAAYSSDVRKSLHICRLALELSQKKKYANTLIGAEIINKAFEEYYSNVLIYVIRSKSLPIKVIMGALITFFKSSSIKVVDIFKLYEKYKHLTGMIGTHLFNFQQFLGVVKKLHQMGILEMKIGSGMKQEISLLINTDSMEYALKDDKKIISVLDFKANVNR